MIEDALRIVAPIKVTIAIVERETPTGGLFPLFECPFCGEQHVRNLYLRPRWHDEIGCREDFAYSYRRNNASGSPRKMGAWRLRKIRSELDDLEKAASTPNSRFSEQRQQRIGELRGKLERERETQRGRMWEHPDKLIASAPFDPLRPPPGPRLDKPLMEATDEEIMAAAGWKSGQG